MPNVILADVPDIKGQSGHEDSAVKSRMFAHRFLAPGSLDGFDSDRGPIEWTLVSKWTRVKDSP
jgi:hypothetical protein